ncbi:MAG TPA: hypothetical protein VK092_06205, partial [Deinococcales bacterium]|nr:hypothetical protein [Deinococcales bacterium]
TEEEAGGLNGFGETFAALPAASPGDEAEPNRADGHTPTQEGTSAASPPAAGENGNFHVTRRRPFRPRERGPAYAPEKPAAPWLQAANQSRAAEAEAEAEAGGSGPKSEPTAPPRAAADAEQPAPSAGPVEAVRELLRQPDLPSIIQAADVARRLGLEPAEAASALETLSAEPDSRLSAVRPGFWLLKRAGPDG